MDLQQITDQLVTVDSGQDFFYLLGLQLYISYVRFLRISVSL